MPIKPDALDRLVQLLLLVAAVTTIANGLFMVAKPLDWYVFVPTVVTTGPPNAHFIRDIGLAYLGSGLILLSATADPARRRRDRKSVVSGKSVYVRVDLAGRRHIKKKKKQKK